MTYFTRTAVSNIFHTTPASSNESTWCNGTNDNIKYNPQPIMNIIVKTDDLWPAAVEFNVVVYSVIPPGVFDGTAGAISNSSNDLNAVG